MSWRGVLAEYYRMAHNVSRLHRLKWIMEQSLTKTLASKLKISVSTVYQRYKTTIQTEHGPRVALQVIVNRADNAPLVATWGRTTLVQNTNVILNDDPKAVWTQRTELVERLLADTCELCGSNIGVEVHHLRGLKDLNRPGKSNKPEWLKVMAARQRKTLAVCRPCHLNIHAGQPTKTREQPTKDWRAV